jgi:gluconolactonase
MIRTTTAVQYDMEYDEDEVLTKCAWDDDRSRPGDLERLGERDVMAQSTQRSTSNARMVNMPVISIAVRAAVVVLVATTPWWADASAGDEIVPPGAKLELLYASSSPNAGGMTEGPAAAPDGGIYFSFIPAGAVQGQILRYDAATGKTGVFASDSGKSNGLAFDARGDLIACEGADHGGRCVSRWNVKTGKRTVLVDRFDGKRFNAPNDVTIDAKGRIYFTDPKYVGDEPRELQHRAVYRIDPDGGVQEFTHDVEKPNGIAISPDQKTLYVADTNNGADRADPASPPPRKGAMKVVAFPLSPAGKVDGPRRTIVDFGGEDGCDGMAVDVRGNLYLAARSHKRPGVLVVDAAGKELAFVSTAALESRSKQADAPVGLPSNCEFGRGDASKTLYVTIDKSLYRIELSVDGYHIPRQR